MTEVRPELHRYCARLTGSLFDGEDIVQDTLARALAVVDDLNPGTPLRPWLFRIAHNRALDHLRRQAVRRSEPIDAATEIADDRAPDAADVLARRQAVDTALSRFTELPILQRSLVILKDVLGHSNREICDLLDLTPDSVKAHLSRGRARLRQINATSPAVPAARPASEQAARFSALFNRHDWDALRALLAEDVRLTQAGFPDRTGRRDVGLFFTIYAATPSFRLAPAHLAGGEGPEVIAVFDHPGHPHPAYLMQVEWRGPAVARIRDFRHARYILDGAGLILARP